MVYSLKPARITFGTKPRSACKLCVSAHQGNVYLMIMSIVSCFFFRVRTLTEEQVVDFTDRAYQVRLYL